MELMQTRDNLKKILDNFDHRDPILGLLHYIILEPESVKEFVDLYHNYVMAEIALNNWFDEG